MKKQFQNENEKYREIEFFVKHGRLPVIGKEVMITYNNNKIKGLIINVLLILSFMPAIIVIVFVCKHCVWMVTGTYGCEKHFGV